MGHIKEPKGIDITVDNKPLDAEKEKRIKEFIRKSKKRNEKFIEQIKEITEK